MKRKAFVKLLMTTQIWGGVASGQLVPGVEPVLPEGGPVETLPSPERVEALEQGDFLGDGISKIILERAGVVGISREFDGLAVGVGVDLPSPATLARRIRPYLEGGLWMSELEAIADEILAHYDAEGFPVMLLDVPEQDFGSGVVRVLVEEGRYGRVGVLPPKYGRRQVLAAGMHLRGGEVIRRGALDRQLAWFGRTPFRTPRLLVSPGSEPGTADVLVQLVEQRPWRIMLGYDNGGARLLGEDRLVAAVSGMTPGEHVLGWQGVLGTPARTLQANSVAWEIPWHELGQTTELTAALAEVEVLGVAGGLTTRNEGTSWALGLRQRAWLPSLWNWQQRVTAGVEMKSTDQFVLFGSAAVAPGSVRMLQATLGYGLERAWDEGGARVDLAAVLSPGGLVSGNEDVDFQAYDPLAEAAYKVLRVDGVVWWDLPADFMVQVRGSGQWSDTRLLPAEQFAVGGARSVRGVDERDLFGDYGWSGSLELMTPVVRAWDGLGLRGVGFLDHGWVGLNRAAGTGAASATSLGLGLRLGWRENVDFRLDHGWRLDEGGGQTHFAIRMMY